MISELDGVAITDAYIGIRCTWKLDSSEDCSLTFLCTTPYAAGYVKQTTYRHLVSFFERISASSLVRNLKHDCHKIIGGGVFGGGDAI